MVPARNGYKWYHLTVSTIFWKNGLNGDKWWQMVTNGINGTILTILVCTIFWKNGGKWFKWYHFNHFNHFLACTIFWKDGGKWFKWFKWLKWYHFDHSDLLLGKWYMKPFFGKMFPGPRPQAGRQEAAKDLVGSHQGEPWFHVERDGGHIWIPLGATGNP